MAFCKRCGKELGEGEAFCPACGTPVRAGPGPAPPGPARPGTSRRTGRTIILLVMALTFLALSFTLFNVQAPADYRVTITVDEFALCHTDQTVDNNPADNVAEIVFRFGYGGVTKETSQMDAPVGDPDGDWKTDSLYKPTGGNTVSFNVHGTDSVQISLFMLDYDGKSEMFPDGIYDTIDIFDSKATGVERPGVSGLYFSMELKPQTVSLDFEGDDLPRGYVKLLVAVEKI